jgi:hypothetical protein
MPLDKPSARIYYGENHGVKPTPQTPRPPKPPSQNAKPMCEHKSDKKCNHLYREFRVENTSDIIFLKSFSIVKGVWIYRLKKSNCKHSIECFF